MAALFSLAAVAVVPLWLLMIAAPRWPATLRVVAQPWSYAPLAVVYTTMVALNAATVVPAVIDNPRLATVAPLLATPTGATIAWIHFLTFDVFVGRWVFLDSRARAVNPWLMAPVLLLVFAFGPAGFLTYLLVRLTRRPSGRDGRTDLTAAGATRGDHARARDIQVQRSLPSETTPGASL